MQRSIYVVAAVSIILSTAAVRAEEGENGGSGLRGELPVSSPASPPPAEKTTVKAPFTHVNTDSQGTTTVKAPLVKVQSNQSAGSTKVHAPLVKVDSDKSAGTVKVRAPFVKVDSEGQHTKTVRAPFVKVDRVGDMVHIRAPFVDKWKKAEPDQDKAANDARKNDKNDHDHHHNHDEEK